MKIRSPKLYAFLLEKGVLDKGAEAIAEAKAEYRRVYKHSWKKEKGNLTKELRPAFTFKERMALTLKARELALTPTAYIRLLALESIGQQTLIPDRDRLLKILQLVGISNNMIRQHSFKYPFSEASDYLHDAERLLLEYLKIADAH